MSIQIYSIAYQTPVSPAVWLSLLKPLPPDVIRQVEKYRRWQDAYGCLFGKYLLLAALREARCAGGLNDLKVTVYGRPYLEGGPDFNISHSGTRVACIISDTGGVGIDLEEIRELDFGDFKNQFTPGEWETIRQSPEPLHAFYHYWTAKECLSKADGRGLNLPLADLKIEQHTSIQLGGRNWNLGRIDSFAGYVCHIAAEEPVKDPFLKEFTPEEALWLNKGDA